MPAAAKEENGGDRRKVVARREMMVICLERRVEIGLGNDEDDRDEKGDGPSGL